MMSLPTNSFTGKRVAVRSVSARADVERALTERGASNIQWFEAKDDDELNHLALQGKFDCIVYEKLDLMLTAIWKGDVDWQQWKQRGIRVEIAEQCGPPDWQSMIESVEGSYRTWRRGERRRQIIAAILLSIAGLIALLTILQATPVSP
ncbi:MAG: hypothetical protein HZA51_18730 [Planctomycetes bacterium]|nr:hypothetical protein [Planctomycetota bacterium]